MLSSNRVQQGYRSFLLVLSIIFSISGFAGRGGGGFGGDFHQGNMGNSGYHHDDDGYHQGTYNNLNNGYHHDDDYNAPYVGNYSPGNGWVAPTVILNNDNVNSNCQMVQQCDDNGSCVLNEECN